MNLSPFLRDSATFSETLANYTCDLGHTEGSCGWYHGPWQYFRLLDMVGSPLWHHDFFVDSINSAVEANNSILISGTADYTMLALVIDSLEFSNNDFQIDILDSCLTPLVLNDWYALSVGYSVNTIHQDVREMNKRNKEYDLIVADEFLTRFSSPGKSEVLENWSSLLAPDGKIVTTIRTDSDVEEETGLGDEEVRSFPDRARSNALNYDDFPIEPQRMESLAKRFAEGYDEHVRYPIKNKSEGIDLFNNSGFSILDAQVNAVEREVGNTEVCQAFLSK